MRKIVQTVYNSSPSTNKGQIELISYYINYGQETILVSKSERISISQTSTIIVERCIMSFLKHCNEYDCWLNRQNC